MVIENVFYKCLKYILYIMANKIVYLMVSWQNLPVLKFTNNFSDEPLSGHNIFVLLTMILVKYTLHAISFFRSFEEVVRIQDVTVS